MPSPPENPSPQRDRVSPGPGATGPLHPRKAPPPPRAVSATTVIATGTAAFLLAFVILAISWSWVGRHDHRIWFWTCLAGWVLGLAGLALVRRHRSEGRVPS